MNEKPPSGSGNAPDLGSATTKIVELFERSLAEREDLKKWIDELSSKSNPTIRDRLCLALYRHQLSFREPSLGPGISLTGVGLWGYWAGHPQEGEEYFALEDEIRSYLMSTEDLDLDRVRKQSTMLELIQQDQITFTALYPFVEEIFKKPAGRRVSRPNVAVRALQLKIDTGRSWMEIASEECDCGKSVHDDCCKENLRQSVRKLRDLLQKCGVEVPST